MSEGAAPVDSGGVRIGVFDSGLGGLSVVRSLWALAPGASIIYVADTAHVPYGGRSGSEIQSFALGITAFLIEQGATLIAMACNMSSAYALGAARSHFPQVPVMGVLQAGAAEAAELGGRIAVLATEGTVASGQYPMEIRRQDAIASVMQEACPEFVPLIEAGYLGSAETEAEVHRHLAPCVSFGARTIVLGCTHYPFLLPNLVRQAPAATRFVDPGRRLARQILDNIGGNVHRGDSRFYLTAASDTFRPVGSQFLGTQLPPPEPACWQDGGRLEAGQASVRKKELYIATS